MLWIARVQEWVEQQTRIVMPLFRHTLSLFLSLTDFWKWLVLGSSSPHHINNYRIIFLYVSGLFGLKISASHQIQCVSLLKRHMWAVAAQLQASRATISLFECKQKKGDNRMYIFFIMSEWFWGFSLSGVETMSCVVGFKKNTIKIMISGLAHLTI